MSLPCGILDPIEMHLPWVSRPSLDNFAYTSIWDLEWGLVGPLQDLTQHSSSAMRRNFLKTINKKSQFYLAIILLTLGATICGLYPLQTAWA